MGFRVSMASKRKTYKKTIRIKGKKRKAHIETRADYKRLPGSSRRYVNIRTGKSISRKALDKKFQPTPRHILQPGYSHKRFRKKLSRYQFLVRDYVRKQRNLGNTITIGQARRSAAMKKIIRDLERGQQLKQRGNHHEGNQLIINALEQTTRRDGVAHDVIPGESPKFNQSTEYEYDE